MFCRLLLSSTFLLIVFSSFARGGELIGPGQDDFDREVGQFEPQSRSLDYELFRPPGHEGSDLPLTIFLHGLTDGLAFKQSRLNDTMRGLVHATQRDNFTGGGCDAIIGGNKPSCAEWDDAYASYLLVPKNRNGDSWSGYHDQLGNMISDVTSRYAVDQSRIYVAGYSDGGFATVDLLEYRTDLFAAAVSISGGGSASASTIAALTETPTWFFHGRSDPVVSPQQSSGLANATRAAGGDSQLSLVRGGHNAGYEFAFSGDDNVLFPWLFMQEKSSPDNAPIPPVAAYQVRDLPIDGIADNQGDEVHNMLFELHAIIGERDGQADYVGRYFAKFDLPDSEDLGPLESATLRTYLRSVSGEPAGPLSVFHSVSDNRIAAATDDFEDASYADTNLDLFQPTDAGRQYYEIDVTDLVKLDYEQESSARSSFRFEIDSLSFVEDGTSGNYRIRTSGVNRPELLLTFQELVCDPLTKGDLDANGTVNFEDFAVLSANFGVGIDGPGGHEIGDIDCNGTVEFADFLILSSNFGLASTAASVPEPSGLNGILLSIGCVLLLARTKSKV